MHGMLLLAHSGVRYLVLIAALVALGVLLSSLRRPFDARSRKFTSAFTGLLDLQVLLGLLNLATVHVYPALAGHVTMMLASALVAHGVVIVNRHRPAERQSNGFVAAGIVVSLLLIVMGIMAIGAPILGTR